MLVPTIIELLIQIQVQELCLMYFFELLIARYLHQHLQQYIQVTQTIKMANQLQHLSKILVSQSSPLQQQKPRKNIGIATTPLPMKRQHIHQVAELFTKNFLSNNPIWKSFNLDNKEVYKFFVNQVALHLDSQQRISKQLNQNFQFNKVYFYQGKIIAAGMNFQLHEYLKLANSPGQSQTLKHFQILQTYGKKLFNSVNLEQYEKGKHIYGSFIVVDENVDPQIKQTFRKSSMIYTYRKFWRQGFKSMILRTSNIRSQQIYLGLGANILSQVKFELKGTNFELKLLKLQFENPTFKKLMGL